MKTKFSYGKLLGRRFVSFCMLWELKHLSTRGMKIKRDSVSSGERRRT